MLSKDGIWLAITGDKPGDFQEVRTSLTSEAAWLLTDAAGEHAMAVDPVSGLIYQWNGGRVLPALTPQSPSMDSARRAFNNENDLNRAKGLRARNFLVVVAAVSDEGTIATIATGWRLADGLPLDIFRADGAVLETIRLAPPLRPDGKPLGLNGMQIRKDRVWIADSAGTVHEYALERSTGGVH